ncbi:unnamed protein product, partial [Mesorhabditis belari]|uniref:ER membrane protein complex subunit 4 n=1 Tax=Mesorhabditis belari TaxID=2138241 RepID=A0AAF3EB02_9BILA
MSLATWRLDAGTASRSARTADSQSYFPPGFSPIGQAMQQNVEAEAAADQQEHLMRKRAWDVAMGPAKSLPMNMFMMYMAGRSISIFPIMMVAMMLWRPLKTMFSVNSTFKPLQDDKTGSLILHKILFVLGNFGVVALAIYKVHSMGLLPNYDSDWLEFIPEAQRGSFSLSNGDIFI